MMASLLVRLISIKSDTAPWHEMGIVLDAKFRGQGYAVEALKLLLGVPL